LLKNILRTAAVSIFLALYRAFILPELTMIFVEAELTCGSETHAYYHMVLPKKNELKMRYLIFLHKQYKEKEKHLS